MSISVDIAGAKARLSELVARAQAGEKVVITRDNSAFALLRRLPRAYGIRAAIEEIRAARFGLAATKAEEPSHWRDEGRRS